MKLCVNADDYALTSATTEGILSAMDEGLVTSTSVITVAGRLEDVAHLASRENVSVGLHVSLTHPSVPGRLAFPNPWVLAAAVLSGQVGEAEIRAECEQQLAELRLVHGRPVTHLDAHEHVHALPMVRRVLTAMAAEHGIGPVRLPRERPLTCLKARVLDLAFARERTSIPFFGLGLMGRRMTVPAVQRQILQLEKLGATCAEWMVHPGAPGDRGEDELALVRAHELDVLRELGPWLADRTQLVPRNALT
jgi:predicted glycoside hydrolase/deacetylase ChbG (UPF0249 family)